MGKLRDLRVMGISAGNGTVLYPFRNNLIMNIEVRGVYKTPDDRQWYINFDCPLSNKFSKLYASSLVKPDIIIGHPSCGNSSVLAYSRGKKLTDPSQDPSMNLFVKGIEHLKPKIFLFENLSAFLKMMNPEEMFPGYKLKYIQGSVSKFGNSQITRKRLVIIGIRDDLKRVSSSDFELPSKDSLHLKLVKELQVDLNNQEATFCNIREDIDKEIAIFGGEKLTYRQIRKWWRNNPTKKRFSTGEDKMKNAPGVYRNLLDDYPLTVRKGNREFNPEGMVMTPRERAKIMGVPDKFLFYHNPKSLIYTINKANVTVTKCFPYEISLWFKKCLTQILEKHGQIS